MKTICLRGSAILLAFLGGVALAQTPPPDGSKPDQNGKQEPSAKNTGDTPARADVLVNGALAVPGAPTDTSTVPAKFSKKNDADDHLLLLGYTFKGLSDDAEARHLPEREGQAGRSQGDGSKPADRRCLARNTFGHRLAPGRHRPTAGHAKVRLRHEWRSNCW